MKRGAVRAMTGYAKDILPLFRTTDIGCMTPKGVRLGDVQWMCNPAADHGFDDHGDARRVFAALSAGFMPPGRKWPQEWLDIYSNWMANGFQP
jgi:hypothetical protein